MEILQRKELENMKLFYEYISLIACPTSFGIASGVLSFTNYERNNMICSSYFVNDSNELLYSKVLIVDYEGKYEFVSKGEKYLPGIRIAIQVNELDEKLIYDKIIVNKDLSVIEYGYFPCNRINFVKTKEDTNTKIKLPISNYLFKKTEYKEFNVYKDLINDIYFIEYEVAGMFTIDNKSFLPGQKGIFKIEPIRFWIDNASNYAISQNVILGGIPYLIPDENNYEYDDYYKSDLYNAVNIIEEDIKVLDKLIKKEKNKIKKL